MEKIDENGQNCWYSKKLDLKVFINPDDMKYKVLRTSSQCANSECNCSRHLRWQVYFIYDKTMTAVCIGTTCVKRFHPIYSNEVGELKDKLVKQDDRKKELAKLIYLVDKLSIFLFNVRLLVRLTPA